jgi:hypothetical protein
MLKKASLNKLLLLLLLLVPIMRSDEARGSLRGRGSLRVALSDSRYLHVPRDTTGRTLNCKMIFFSVFYTESRVANLRSCVKHLLAVRRNARHENIEFQLLNLLT